MAGRSRTEAGDDFSGLAGTTRVLIVQSPYYADIAAELLAGARAVLDAAGVGYDRIAVPGALEIPQAVNAYAADGRQFPRRRDGAANAVPRYHGVIALGCVIRGETSHYDIVCNNANHWLYRAAADAALPVGNAILTVDTHAQALARARGGADGKGGDAARACLSLVAIARSLAGGPT